MDWPVQIQTMAREMYAAQLPDIHDDRTRIEA